MIEFMRSLFGLGSSDTRKVIGAMESIDAKEVRYIQESKSRLASLHLLYNRYKNTPHAAKIKAVYDKTRLIHHFLISRNRGYELELFHLQHTEHFISAFSVIMDVHEKEHAAYPEPSETRKEEEAFIQKRIEKVRKPVEDRFEVPRLRQEKQVVVKEAEPKSAEAVLSVPLISINTVAKIPYTDDVSENGPHTKAIGYISSQEEKDVFLQHVSGRLGLENISYVGNASMHLPGSGEKSVSRMVPVIYWRESLYALNLNDYRIFPVQMYRRSS